MTRSVVVTPEAVKVAELEEQLRILQLAVQKNTGDLETLKETISKYDVECSGFRDEVQVFIGVVLKDMQARDRGKCSSSEGTQENRVMEGEFPENKGLLSKPNFGSAKDQGNSVNFPTTEPMLLKIELIAFEGKEPRAWLRKCVKYFEVYKVQIFNS